MRGAALENKTTDEWLEIFKAADLPAMPCHTLETLPNDPHLKAVGLLGFENHPTEGRTTVIRSTIKVDGNYPSARSTAVPNGWDTNDLLQELGYSLSEIAAFTTQKAAFNYGK